MLATTRLEPDLLDLWARGGADAAPRGRSSPARLGAPDAADSGLVRGLRPRIGMRVGISLIMLISLFPLSEAPSRAQEPDSPVARGRALFLEKGCAQCHRVGAVGASIAPDLSRAGARYGEGDLTRWLTASPEPSPGARVRELDPSESAVTRLPLHMPTLVLSEQEARALAAYLSSLR
jgi:mono/diheme cytochrome c family protein